MIRPSNPLIPLARSEVFVDGLFSDPRINHAEGLAVDNAGAIWCGGEDGELIRISPDGSRLELVASTGGFTLGLAFDGQGRLYACDLKHAAVYRLDPSTGELTMFATGDGAQRMRVPNVPAVDLRRNCLYVSDSYDFHAAGPGVWRFDLDTGAGTLWYNQSLRFANGLALSADGNWLYVAETFARRVSRIPIRSDGSAGAAETLLTEIPALPDGLALDTDGRLYVTCYEPSQIYRVEASGALTLLIDDPEAHTLCHPTNIAFRGSDLFNSNLGRWHITRTPVDATGLPLP